MTSRRTGTAAAAALAAALGALGACTSGFAAAPLEGVDGGAAGDGAGPGEAPDGDSGGAAADVVDVDPVDAGELDAPGYDGPAPAAWCCQVDGQPPVACFAAPGFLCGPSAGPCTAGHCAASEPCWYCAPGTGGPGQPPCTGDVEGTVAACD